jgi:FMN phosphatase YigB (HAD superfamily)
MSSVTYVFFDVGGTLGDVTVHGNTAQLALYPDTQRLLDTLRAMGSVKLGVISNVLPTMTSADLAHMLTTAGIGTYFVPNAIVASTDARSAKPAAAIYQFASTQVGQPIGTCLFVGEDLAEVIGARAAGMQAQLKPRP